MIMLRLVLVTGVVAVSAFGAKAFAQAPSAAAPVVSTTPVQVVEPQPAAPALAATPAPIPAQAAAQPAATPPTVDQTSESDHDSVVGHVGVGYLGYTNVPFGYLADANTNAYPAAQLAHAPVVGIRYWFSQGLGLDVGLGFTTTFGNNSNDTGNGSVTTNATAPTAFVLHGGLPLSFASAQHYSFELIPELNFGYAQQALGTGAANIDHTGMHFDMGARVGAEVHFGFMGLPKLSLQGTLGLRVDVNQTQTKTTPTTAGAPITTNSSSRSTIGTTVYDKPWDIFLGNISAIYYL